MNIAYCIQMTSQILFCLYGKVFLDNIQQRKGWAQKSAFLTNTADNSGADCPRTKLRETAVGLQSPTELTHYQQCWLNGG